MFLRFFEERGHRVVPSSSLIPPPESGLLLTNAGMNQFIPYFLGHATAPFPRAVTVQKVLPRPRHRQRRAHRPAPDASSRCSATSPSATTSRRRPCAWAHELVTEVYGIDPERLWVTVYEPDDEAVAAWDAVGMPRRDGSCGAARSTSTESSRTTGRPTRPGRAGPCSEIFVDRGARFGPDGGPDVDEERFIEIWNLVFMQDEVDDRSNVIVGAPGEERRHRLEPRARRHGAAGRRQRVRDRPAAPAPRGRRVAVGPDARTPTSATDVSLEGDRRARAGDHLPDRRRGPALQRGSRLHPSPDAPAGRLATRGGWASSAT